MTVFSMLMPIATQAPLLAQQAGAAAGGSAQQQPGLFGGPMVLFPLLFIMMYFILIRPQRQKQKEQESTQKSIQPGDEVVTIGGAHGVVTTVHEKTVTVRVAEGKIEFDRTAIAQRRPKVSEAEVVEKK